MKRLICHLALFVVTVLLLGGAAMTFLSSRYTQSPEQIMQLTPAAIEEQFGVKIAQFTELDRFLGDGCCALYYQAQLGSGETRDYLSLHGGLSGLNRYGTGILYDLTGADGQTRIPWSGPARDLIFAVSDHTLLVEPAAPNILLFLPLIAMIACLAAIVVTDVRRMMRGQ